MRTKETSVEEQLIEMVKDRDRFEAGFHGVKARLHDAERTVQSLRDQLNTSELTTLRQARELTELARREEKP